MWTSANARTSRLGVEEFLIITGRELIMRSPPFFDAPNKLGHSTSGVAEPHGNVSPRIPASDEAITSSQAYFAFANWRPEKTGKSLSQVFNK